MNKFLLIHLLIFFTTINIFNFNLKADLPDSTLIGIVKEIVLYGDKDSRTDFEIAKQSFLNINTSRSAKQAAKIIADKWTFSSEEELMDQTRYSQITDKNQIVKAGRKLVTEDYKDFIEDTLDVSCKELK